MTNPIIDTVFDSKISNRDLEKFPDLVKDLTQVKYVTLAEIERFSKVDGVLKVYEKNRNLHASDYVACDIIIIGPQAPTSKNHTSLIRVVSNGKGNISIYNYLLDSENKTFEATTSSKMTQIGKVWHVTATSHTADELSKMPQEHKDLLSNTFDVTAQYGLRVALTNTFYEHDVVDNEIHFKPELRDRRKFTALKCELMDKLFIPKELKKMTSIGREVNMAKKLEPSVLFTDIEFDTAPTSKLEAVNFQNLPFEDFMILTDAYWHDDESMIKDGFLFRLKRLENGRIFLFSYSLNAERKYQLRTILESDTDGVMKTRLSSPENEKYIVEVILGMKRFIYFMTHFKHEVRLNPSKAQLAKHNISGNLQQQFVEYTMDLTKPISTVKGPDREPGTHRSPIEHVRRGFYRRSKYGKLSFIKATTVNKGKGGRMERDYKVN